MTFRRDRANHVAVSDLCSPLRAGRGVAYVQRTRRSVACSVHRVHRTAHTHILCAVIYTYISAGHHTRACHSESVWDQAHIAAPLHTSSTSVTARLPLHHAGLQAPRKAAPSSLTRTSPRLTRGGRGAQPAGLSSRSPRRGPVQPLLLHVVRCCSHPTRRAAQLADCCRL